MNDSTQFMGTPVAADDAKFWVIPANDEQAGQLRSGQKNAPEAIIAASLHVPQYDEEVAVIVAEKAPICTVEGGDTETVRMAFEAAFELKAIPVVLGGSSTVSFAGIQALSEAAEDFTVLHIGARSNMRDPMSGGHAGQSVMRSVIDIKNMKRLVQVGTMALYADENDIIFDEDSKVEPFFACDIARADDESWHEDVIQELSTPVYLSIDVSALSRSVIADAGTPEPGGLEWWPLLRLLKKVASRRRIAAVDLVNMVPSDNPTSAYVAARLVYKVMAYIVAGGKML